MSPTEGRRWETLHYLKKGAKSGKPFKVYEKVGELLSS
jgi:hypothetical protein